MRFIETAISGAFVVEPRKIEDERGFFARAWCRDTALSAGLVGDFKQCNMAASRRSHTLRGLHFQRAPYEEVKVVRCTRGAIFDVVVDLRPDSPTYRKWHGVELTDANHLALYVPAGCATGYLTLADDTAIFYHTSEIYDQKSATGVRFDDPAFGIAWPAQPRVLSAQDRSWPHLDAADATSRQ
jgi:dTDP-4-dehydrorhamnose 3,5-epimerase